MANRQKRKKRLSKTIKKRTRSAREVMWINFWNIKTKELKGERL